jgi:hypothetical protein
MHLKRIFASINSLCNNRNKSEAVEYEEAEITDIAAAFDPVAHVQCSCGTGKNERKQQDITTVHW